MTTLHPLFVNAIVDVLRQGDMSQDHGGCLYRGPENRKCIAGQILPDELYTPEMENEGAASTICAPIFEKVLSEAGIDVEEGFIVLRQLQANWHDRLASRSRFQSTEEWRRAAINKLPEEYRTLVKDACHIAGVLL